MIVTKYDAYYEKEMNYTMTLDDLFEQGKKKGHYTEEDILAYIRFKGNKVRFLIPMNIPTEKVVTPFGISFVTKKEEKKVLCTIVTEDKSPYNRDIYNPLIEEDAIWDNHWYHPYKLYITTIDYMKPYYMEEEVEDFYFSDFCSMINSGVIEIWEEEN